MTVTQQNAIAGPQTPPEAPETPEVVPCNHASLEDALSHAQSLFPLIPKLHKAKIPTKAGGEYEYDYADLADIIEAVRPILYRCGLSVSQPIDFVKGQDVLTTHLMHKAGGSVGIRSRMRLTLNQSSPQASGSMITYFRRYALCAILNIVADKDDDGRLAESAYGAETPRSRRRSAPRASTSTRSSGKSAPARTDPATDGKVEWPAKDRNKVIAHLAKLDPPIREKAAQENHVATLLGLPEPEALVKLDAEQGAKLMGLLGITS